MPDEQLGHDDPANRVTEILERRAIALARPLTEPEPGDTLEVLVMTVGSERYGLETSIAVEVVIGTVRTIIPGAPRSWQGIVNVRGTLYSVLDLRSHLSLGAAEGPVVPVGVVLVTSDAGLTIGIALEQPPELLRIRRNSLRPTATANGRRGVVAGAVTDELVTLLDLELLMADSRPVASEALG
jgi:purine-binding chemotaxis protein CheW